MTDEEIDDLRDDICLIISGHKTGDVNKKLALLVEQAKLSNKLSKTVRDLAEELAHLVRLEIMHS